MRIFAAISPVLGMNLGDRFVSVFMRYTEVGIIYQTRTCQDA